ncbi:hypothetical protein NDU88_005108 [Pleurodeles waltl]|uniref:Uncharacterized protein n=1 Tax=Pleurodeles waltl TaxID=8319 RepID=A0AAV7WW65_PLEWA|nr:hypothetical protein NDU88_005108 [Pleurodeles waltl]
MDRYTVQNAGVSLPKDPPGPPERGAEPTGAQILAAIESSSRMTQTQIVAIAVDVNLLRADLRVVAERSLATEQKVTCMQSDVVTLKASVAILEAQTRKLEACVEDAEGSVGLFGAERWDRNAGIPAGESGRRLRGAEEVRTAARRSTRCHRAGRGSRVIVRSDGTLSLERRRQEREEAKLLVQTVTSEASSRSGSPCVPSGLSPKGRPRSPE